MLRPRSEERARPRARSRVSEAVRLVAGTIASLNTKVRPLIRVATSRPGSTMRQVATPMLRRAVSSLVLDSRL